MDRSLAVVPLIVLLTMGLVLPASVGASAGSGERLAETADADVQGDIQGEERRLAATAAAAANNTTQHDRPDELDTREDVDDITRWLERRLSGSLERSAVELSRGQADQAEQILGEEFADQFGRYAYVTGRTETTDDDRTSERFRETKETQEEFANAVQEYHATRDEYEEARRNGNEERARERARELQRLARTANRTGSALQADYGALSNGTAADLSEASFVVRNISRNISQQQAEIVRETFIRTTLTLRSDSRRVSFLEPLRLTGRLADENGSTLADRTVQLRIGEQTLRTQTDADGEFTVTFRPTLLRADEQSVAVRYVPRNESAYLGSNGSVTVSVTQVTPNLSVNRRPDTVAFQDRIDVTGRVSAEDVGAGGVPVVVRLGGATLGTTRTDADGTYAFNATVPASVDDGDRSLTATVPLEGQALAGVDRSRAVAVDPTATTLTVSGDQVASETVRVRGTLETPNSTGIPNQPVELVIDGRSVASTRTNAKGAFTERVAVPADLVPEEENVSATLAARYERPDSNLLPSRARTTLRLTSSADGSATGGSLFQIPRLQPEAGSGGGGDGASAGGGSVGGPGVLPGPLPWAVVLGGLLAVVGGAIYVRRRTAVGEGGPTEDEPADTSGDPREAASLEPSTAEPLPMLAGARAALDEDRRDTAVELAYTALKRTTIERLDLPDGTHWEFFVACREAGLDDDRIDTLRRLTELYEQAAFAPQPVSEADANWVVDTAATFDRSSDTGP